MTLAKRRRLSLGNSNILDGLDGFLVRTFPVTSLQADLSSRGLWTGGGGINAPRFLRAAPARCAALILRGV